MLDRPTGTVTFLFTDIEGSTKLWEQHHDLMQQAFNRHEAILRTAIAAHGGYAYKMIGDAFQAAFQTAPAALAASVDAQRALAREDWGEIGRVRVRMALHTGAVEERGDDYVGPLLNRVARLLSTGYGDQILLTATTRELVRDVLPADVTLLDLGEHRLKDLIRPERVFQVVAPDVAADFPPLKSLDTRPNNLPVQSTPLIGREQEVAAVRDLLLRPGVRLVTLTGPGGTGKTRLGLQVAADLLDHFAHGVSFVNLAPIGDPALVASAIAQAVAVREQGGKPLLESLKDYVHDKHLLLLLDNFEHVTSAAPLVADLLAAAPRLAVLVTSREVLHLYGEHDVAVLPLTLPDPRHPVPLEHLTQYEAVRLFIERAQAARSDFAVTNENAPAVAEICYRLDGLPLAIELAAARIRLLPPQAMLQRLTSRLRLLTGGPRDLPERQQTLRGAITWSYDLLEADEQALFRRLAVFVGGFALDAVETVCNGSGNRAMDVLDAVESLVGKSLLREAAGAEDDPRFSMLETIREYALERLDAGGEKEAVRRLHAEHYLALVEAAEGQLYGSNQASVDRLEMEHGNLRAALAWCLTEPAGQVEMGVRLAHGLYWFWYLRGHLSEGRAWSERMLARSDMSERVWMRATALHGAGAIAMFQGDLATARRWAEESVGIWRELTDRSGLADALFLLGVVALNQGDAQTALPVLEECRVLFRDLGVQTSYATTLMHLGDVALEQGHYGTARARYEECLTLQRQLGNTWFMAQVLNNLGEVARCEGEYDRAGHLYEESLHVFRELDTTGDVARSLHNLGYVACMQGHADRALMLFTESIHLFRERGNKRGIAECLTGLALISGTHEKQPADALRAATLLGAAEAEFEEIRAARWPADRLEYERAVAAARDTLGEEAFVSARATGRTMPLEQAIAYALETGDPAR